jgi:hypothetical protein
VPGKAPTAETEVGANVSASAGDVPAAVAAESPRATPTPSSGGTKKPVPQSSGGNPTSPAAAADAACPKVITKPKFSPPPHRPQAIDSLFYFAPGDALTTRNVTLVEFLNSPNFSKEYMALHAKVIERLGTNTAELVGADPNQWKIIAARMKEAAGKFLANAENHNMLFAGAKELVLKEGIAPLAFSVDEIRASATSPTRAGGDVQVSIVKGFPAECSQLFEPGSIWQAASQFNGLESCTHAIAALMNYATDHTQGPSIVICSDLIAIAMRQVAHQHHSYPDSIVPVLECCTIDGESVLSKYPTIYKNGWFSPQFIADDNHLEKLADQIEANIGKFKVLTQWCLTADGTPQLMIMSAAPAFIGGNISEAKRKSLFRRISKAILCAQYECCGLIQARTGKNIHITPVGMGVFGNDKIVLNDALATLLKSTAGSGVTIRLHSFGGNDWDAALAAAGYTIGSTAAGITACIKKRA